MTIDVLAKDLKPGDYLPATKRTVLGVIRLPGQSTSLLAQWRHQPLR